jgi:hypothetical protein
MNKKEILFLLDRSGSMGQFGDETRTQLNNIIEQAKDIEGDTEVLFSLVLFDNQYNFNSDNLRKNSNYPRLELEKLIDRKNIKSVEPINKDVNFSRGGTPLYDAIGITFNELGEKLSELNEQDRPENVTVFILTDGMENSSTEFSKSQVSEMVKRQEEKYNWEVIFLSSDLDAVNDASDYSTGNFGVNNVAGSKGRSMMYSNINEYMSQTLSGNNVLARKSMESSDEDMMEN